ncbi:ChrR family anti-sigma-E factor [Zavarzinia compransoris]|uniref:ChrR family anti-sigma-E factor n=1 Tax=Zavarzinia marina TaxID=2911065 RepID=UPI001F3F7615|nr:ChrR family anti-sigma-E factor [Zavarzinia marina]MCF4165050.1 ChrR family anti-sigma-E factor [Zavarzinia marina]
MTWSHPFPEMLIDHAAAPGGGLQDLLIDIHADYCEDCRRQLRWLSGVGALALEQGEPADLTPEAAAGMIRKIVDMPPATFPPLAPPSGAERGILPPSLRAYLHCDADGLRWRPLLPGVRRHVIDSEHGMQAELMKIRGGRSVPRHTHTDGEMTLVLTGGFHDGHAHYGPGDICFADPSIHHRPTADAGGDCICFCLTRAVPHFTGPVARMLNVLSGRRD